MKTAKKPLRCLGRTDGQALTEAAIMLSLLAFAWMMSAYQTFRSQSLIRSAMGARHGAWMRGHGLNPSEGQMENDFFDVDWDIAAVNSQGSATVQLPPPITAPNSIAYQVENINVGYVTLGKQGHPFVGLNIKSPIMKESAFNIQFVSDDTSGQWPRITEFFTDKNQLATYAQLFSP